jgi:hypothetical protein
MKTLLKTIFCICFIGSNIQFALAQTESLKILSNGNVGIGTSTPEVLLDVNGTLKATNIIVDDSLTSTNGNFTTSLKALNPIFSGILTADSAAITNNSTISNAFIGDVGHGATWASFSHKDASSVDSYGFLHHSQGTSSFINIKSGDSAGYIGFRVDNIDKMIIKPSGNVGIGTQTPKAKLQVEGAILATSVNGEKPPMIFDVGRKDVLKSWQATNVDIGPLCGDEDGCTIKILLQVLSRDEVRVIEETIYIEQINKSNNKNPGLNGWTLQQGGGDVSFVLNTTKGYDITPHPWDWIYVRNYGNSLFSPDLPEGVYTGYTVQFMTIPNVIATVIIYDR